MGRNLLLLSYCFPPANIIGAVRPYQIARFFQQRGWNVQVISISDSSIADTDSADVSGISSVRIPAPWLVSWLNTVTTTDGRAGILHSAFLRSIKFVVRLLVFPEHFILLRKIYVDEAMRLSADKRFDLVVSSALPFTIHSAARQIARQLSVPWVADNRDLWAASPYRKALPFRRALDRRYERATLADADLILGISESMIAYYRDICGFKKALLIMNGYPVMPIVEDAGEPSRKTLDIVYGGILYGALRDPSPLLKAIASDEQLRSRVEVHFFGSEPDRVSALADTFKECSIACHARVSKSEIAAKYRHASLLLVILGDDVFENGVMTGKFFEYLTHGKPILAIAAEESELARVINGHALGLATRDPGRIAGYLGSLIRGESPDTISPPPELSIEHQLSLLYSAVETLPALIAR